MAAKSKVSQPRFVDSWTPHQAWFSSVTEGNQGKCRLCRDILATRFQAFSEPVKENGSQRRMHKFLLLIQLLWSEILWTPLPFWLILCRTLFCSSKQLFFLHRIVGMLTGKYHLWPIFKAPTAILFSTDRALRMLVSFFAKSGPTSRTMKRNVFREIRKFAFHHS